MRCRGSYYIVQTGVRGVRGWGWVGAVLGPHDFPFSIGRSEAAHSFTAHLGCKMRRIFLTLYKCLGRA
jgi:hypothetical protein